ncbi:amidase signature enzyme, partial [Glonium stellatum]
EVDVILCPAGPGAAPQLDGARYWGYTAVWNLLDYPAVVFPVSRVDVEVDGVEAGYVPRSRVDRENFESYSPEKYAGAPISLQLVGRRYEDEKLLETLEFIQEKIGLPFAKFV